MSRRVNGARAAPLDKIAAQRIAEGGISACAESVVLLAHWRKTAAWLASPWPVRYAAIDELHKMAGFVIACGCD